MGTVDADAVANLGLPVCSSDPVQPSDPVLPSGHTKKSGASLGEKESFEKFSMGVTLPTVPPRLVKRVLSGEFVDMGELSLEALREEFKRGAEGDDQKASGKPKFRPVAD